MDDTPKITTIDELVEWIDALLDQEIIFLLTWVQGDGDQKPPSSIATAMHKRAAHLQQLRRWIRHGDETVQQHRD
jgi:hypothetical protein